MGVFDLAALARRITDRSVVLFLGDVDAGKTTLVKQLHERVGGEVVDADLGQAEIGPPAVISLGTYAGGPRAGYFAGDISPRGNFLYVLTGCKKMVERATRPCLIDTDGYVHEGAARAYKSELINLLEPNLLVLLQRERELEYFNLYAAKGVEIVDIAVEHGGLKPREERIRARERAFQQYFARAGLRRWRLSEVKLERVLLGHGGRLDRAIFENLLLGCLVDGAFQSLGILKALNSETIDVLAPVVQASVLQFGSLKVHEDGSHERIRLQA